VRSDSGPWHSGADLAREDNERLAAHPPFALRHFKQAVGHDARLRSRLRARMSSRFAQYRLRSRAFTYSLFSA
jgi:hypothetical protein